MSYQTTYKHYRERMREALAPLGCNVGGEPWEANGDDWGWHLTLGEGEGDIDVSLMLEDSEEFDGDDAKGMGTFSLRAIRFGGEILAVLTPYNYTPDVWVKLTPGSEELDERLALIEGAIPELEEILKAAQCA